ncbi:MAG: hypothetical protein R3268_10675 [Acidiferrobacterales bacterium]|nr:hypothetical protein [Acidiferrobacterales bacterium]
MNRIGIVLILAPLLILGLHYASELIVVEECLDAGGSFNYSTMSCSFTEQWDYVPYSVRHRWNLNIALGISLLGLVVTLLGGRKPRAPRLRTYS